jgi:polyhydroxybutyrate depolymerase
MRFIVCVFAVVACGGGDSGPRQMMFGTDARPAILDVPPAFDDGRDYPLIVALHGYSGNGFQHAAYFGLSQLVDADEALMIAPDGTTDDGGRQFWNADPACCDFGGKNPDDVAYIGKLIDDVIAAWPVDTSRVVLVGHSNGHFMSYRMACERPDVITAIAGLAGAASSMPAACTPARSVNVLHIHGTDDDTVPYAGGNAQGAEASVQQWVMHDGCTPALTPGATYDLENSIAGNETQALAAGCPAGVAVELWRMDGAGHLPNWGPGFRTTLWQWLEDHPRK